jgi:DNA invertase Pin-like site-specific DNA recombinase
MTARITRPVALYARVSTRDKDQDPEMQLVPMREYAESRGWETVEYADHAPANDLRGREQWRALLAAADRRQVERVMVWKLDRGFRSALDALTVAQRLEHAGVAFSVLTQPECDTSSATGRFYFTVLAAVAEMDRQFIAERVKEGMKNAARKGVKLGRPSAMDDPVFAKNWPAAQLRILEGSLSRRKAAKDLGVGQATIKRLLDAA